MERLSDFNEKEWKGFFSRPHSRADADKGIGILDQSGRDWRTPNEPAESLRRRIEYRL